MNITMQIDLSPLAGVLTVAPNGNGHQKIGDAVIEQVSRYWTRHMFEHR